jgi:hypothetical protein
VYLPTEGAVFGIGYASKTSLHRPEPFDAFLRLHVHPTVVAGFYPDGEITNMQE